MTWCIIYLASPRSFMTGRGGTGYNRYDVLKASLTITKRVFPTIDIYVFHEDYTEDDMRGLPPVKHFEKIDFKGFESIYNPTLNSSRGYLMMCRFFSGVMQRHPLLQNYTHYMRLDDDSYFLEPYITEVDVNSFIACDYVFRSLFKEDKPQQSLYEFTMRFLSPYTNPMKRLQLKQFLKSKGFLTQDGSYTGIAPYNNFHISSLRLWNHPIVAKYIDAIEASGGIFRYGWLDANIHAMIVYIFPYIAPSIVIAHTTTFGYRHNYHQSVIGGLGVLCDETLPFYPPISDSQDRTYIEV